MTEGKLPKRKTITVDKQQHDYLIRLMLAVRFHYRGEGSSYRELDPIQEKHKELANLAFDAGEKRDDKG